MTILRYLLALSRTVVMVLGLLALLACGASSVHRLTTVTELATEAVELPDQACFIPDPADEEAQSGNMTPGSAPNAEPTAILTQAILLGSFGSQDHWVGHRLESFNVSLQIRPLKRNQIKLASLALVNSALSRQFTLVGAKPSGTS